jgi:hypothetical protein
MTTVFRFPVVRPPFMEVIRVPDRGIYRANYRNARYHSMVIWEDTALEPTIKRARIMAYDFGELPVIDATGTKQQVLTPLRDRPGRRQEGRDGNQ